MRWTGSSSSRCQAIERRVAGLAPDHLRRWLTRPVQPPQQVVERSILEHHDDDVGDLGQTVGHDEPRRSAGNPLMKWRPVSPSKPPRASTSRLRLLGIGLVVLEMRVKPVGDDRHVLEQVGPAVPAPFLTTSLVSTPAALSFSRTSSACWIGTRLSASPWMISVGGSSDDA